MATKGANRKRRARTDDEAEEPPAKRSNIPLREDAGEDDGGDEAQDAPDEQLQQKAEFDDAAELLAGFERGAVEEVIEEDAGDEEGEDTKSGDPDDAGSENADGEVDQDGDSADGDPEMPEEGDMAEEAGDMKPARPAQPRRRYMLGNKTQGAIHGAHTDDVTLTADSGEPNGSGHEGLDILEQAIAKAPSILGHTLEAAAVGEEQARTTLEADEEDEEEAQEEVMRKIAKRKAREVEEQMGERSMHRTNIRKSANPDRALAVGYEVGRPSDRAFVLGAAWY